MVARSIFAIRFGSRILSDPEGHKTHVIGQDPASATDREDRAGNPSVCALKIIFFRALVVGAVNAQAQIS